MNLAMYILVNGDLEMSPAKASGQVGHAVASYFYHTAETTLIDNYMKNNQTKIILDCPQTTLEKYAKEYPNTAIYDAGKTELEPNTLTCVCIGIFDRDNEEVPKPIKRMRLYKANNFTNGFKAGMASILKYLKDKESVNEEFIVELCNEFAKQDKDFKDLYDYYEIIKTHE